MPILDYLRKNPRTAKRRRLFPMMGYAFLIYFILAVIAVGLSIAYVDVPLPPPFVRIFGGFIGFPVFTICDNRIESFTGTVLAWAVDAFFWVVVGTGLQCIVFDRSTADNTRSESDLTNREG